LLNKFRDNVGSTLRLSLEEQMRPRDYCYSSLRFYLPNLFATRDIHQSILFGLQVQDWYSDLA